MAALPRCDILWVLNLLGAVLGYDGALLKTWWCILGYDGALLKTWCAVFWRAVHPCNLNLPAKEVQQSLQL